MKKNILKKVGVGIGLSLALLPFLALAQAPPPTTPIISSLSDISRIIAVILNWIIGIIMVISVIMLLFSAFLYLTAGGSEDRVGKAKNYLLYAIVGIVVAVLTFSIEPFIINVFTQR